MIRFRLKPWMVLAAILLLLVLAFFGTFFISGAGRKSSGAESLAGSTAEPVVAGASGFTASIRDFFERLFGLRDVDKEYADLQVRVKQLELTSQITLDLQKENERLNHLLGFEEQYPDFTYMPARVIGKEPGSWFVDFTLDKGSSQGVAINDTVVNEYGLIGKVVDVGGKWCKVMAIIDRQSSVSVIIERTRDNGIVNGSGDPQGAKPVCSIEFLPGNSAIAPGDRVLTTDLGNIFPKGIAVGIVSEVSRDQKLQNYAVMIPTVDFAHIENVLIIKTQKGPTADDIAKEQAQQTQQNQAAVK